MTENVHSAWAGTALTCHRAWRHGTARFSPDRAVPGLLSQHGGTSGTARRATVPLSAVPCRAVPDRARARAGPGGPVGQLYLPAGRFLTTLRMNRTKRNAGRLVCCLVHVQAKKQANQAGLAKQACTSDCCSTGSRRCKALSTCLACKRQLSCLEPRPENPAR